MQSRHNSKKIDMEYINTLGGNTASNFVGLLGALGTFIVTFSTFCKSHGNI